MGVEESKQQVLDEKWVQVGEKQVDEPGQPIFVQSIRRRHIQGEKYVLEITNTNYQEQIAIYRERKLNTQNIVSLYDFEVTKPFLGCARNVSCYNIITERIPYRLNQFSNLSVEEVIYILHETLIGYNELNKYQRLCYPAANMIGIKTNGEVKVWTHSDWSQNGYRKARSIFSSFDSLWNTISYHGQKCNRLLNICSELLKQKYNDFEVLINWVRVTHMKQMIEGRLKLEQRIKAKNFSEIYVQNRPRSYSQNIRKPISIYQHQNPLYILNQTKKPPSQTNVYHHPIAPIPIHHYSHPKQELHNLNKTQPILSKSQANKNITYHHLSPHLEFNKTSNNNNNRKISFSHEQPRTNFFPISQTPYSIKLADRSSQRNKQKNGQKINFSYQKIPTENIEFNTKIEEMKNWKCESLSRNIFIQNTSKTIRKKYNDYRSEGNGRYNVLEKTSYKIGQQPLIEPFQLELKLDKAITRQNNLSKQQTKQYNERDEENSFNEDELFDTPQKTKRIHERRRQLNSKKVAQQFKYYLQQQQQEKINRLNLDTERSKPAQNNSRCIVQRWDEQQSFNT